MQVMTLCHWPSSLARSRGAGGFGVGSCAPVRGDPIMTSGVILVCAVVRGALTWYSVRCDFVRDCNCARVGHEAFD
jgi:hypothetical protein